MRILAERNYLPQPEAVLQEDTPESVKKWAYIIIIIIIVIISITVSLILLLLLLFLIAIITIIIIMIIIMIIIIWPRSGGHARVRQEVGRQDDRARR